MSALASYLEPLSTAAAAFPIVASLSVLPFAIYHYRSHGRVHPWRAFVNYSFIFYLLAAIFLVLLPLPKLPRGAELEAWNASYSRMRTPRLDPTGFFRDMLRTRPGPALNLAAFQAISNFLLFLPFGAYLVYLFKRKTLVAAGLGLLLSLGFELCQFTGNFWIYPGPYRLFDAGDLLLNASGALLGALLTRLLERRRLLPELEALPGPDTPWIGPIRRGFALFIDGLAALLSALALSLAAGELGLGPRLRPALAALVFAFWLILLPALDGGRGLGKRLTFCAIRRRDGRAARPGRLLLRQALAWGAPLALIGSSGWAGADFGTGLAFVTLAGLWLALVLRNLWGLMFGKEKESWIDLRLGTRVRNTWLPPAPEKPGRKPKKRRPAKGTGGKAAEPGAPSSPTPKTRTRLQGGVTTPRSREKKKPRKA